MRGGLGPKGRAGRTKGLGHGGDEDGARGPKSLGRRTALTVVAAGPPWLPWPPWPVWPREPTLTADLLLLMDTHSLLPSIAHSLLLTRVLSPSPDARSL